MEFGATIEQLSAELSGQHSIYRVPSIIADENYEPVIVSIGPYHHGKTKLNWMNAMKLRCFKSLLDRKPDVSIERYWSVIVETENRARDCYAKPMDMDKSEFIKMLVVDGCFIIESIRGYNEINRGMERDLLLFENQIPFFVLCNLFDLIQGPGQHNLLMELILSFFSSVFPGKVLYKINRSVEKVKHILDLVHSNWHPFHHDSNTSATQPGRITLCTASQLKDAKVKFEKRKYDDTTTAISDIEFKVDEGILLMPTLTIQKSTGSVLRNLIVYEDFFLTNNVRPVTDYAALLSWLIYSSEDVQILRQHGIIDDSMRSDQAVADLVNRLPCERIIRRDEFMYGDLFDRINRYKEKCRNRNRAATILVALGRIFCCAH